MKKQQQHSQKYEEVDKLQNEHENDHHIIFIRHAQSEFNKGTIDYVEKNNMGLQDPSWDSLIQIPDFNKHVSYHQDYIDCNITPKGKQQCKKARQSIKHLNVDIILVSPQQRTLETCRQIFGEAQGIRVIVHPLLHQVFRFSCDISKELQHKKKQFKNYDFSEVQKFAEDQNLWFLEILSEEKKKIVFKKLQQANITDYKQKQFKLLELLNDNTIRQSEQDMRHRAHKVKQLIQKIANQKKGQHKKVAIVSHYHTISYLLAQDFDQDHIPIGLEDIKNAKPYQKKLKDLMKYK